MQVNSTYFGHRWHYSEANRKQPIYWCFSWKIAGQPECRLISSVGMLVPKNLLANEWWSKLSKCVKSMICFVPLRNYLLQSDSDVWCRCLRVLLLRRKLQGTIEPCAAVWGGWGNVSQCITSHVVHVDSCAEKGKVSNYYPEIYPKRSFSEGTLWKFLHFI